VNRVGLFDAMPMFWKQMSGENRHAVVAIIDGIMTQAKQMKRIYLHGELLMASSY
jgi:hypothetical protein